MPSVKHLDFRVLVWLEVFAIEHWLQHTTVNLACLQTHIPSAMSYGKPSSVWARLARCVRAMRVVCVPALKALHQL